MSAYLASLFSLKGKTALVTGGAKGLGFMMAEALVKAGATVYISSRSASACEAAATQLSAHGTCIAMPFDLSLLENIIQLREQIVDAGNGLDILINNSGKTWGASIEKYPEKAWDSVMDLNTKTPFYLVQQLLPLLKAAGTAANPARIINIGSIAGIGGDTLRAYAYVASKAALHRLTQALSRDLAKKHITVNAIAPGFFLSKMTKYIAQNDALKAQVLAQIPMRRMGEPKEIGALAVYLSSPAAAFMTGNIIALDGGYLVGN